METDGFVIWTFEIPMNELEMAQTIWMLIFGEIEIEIHEADSFEVKIEVEGGKTEVKIGHDDAEMLASLSEAFYERRWETWPPNKLTVAVAKTFKHLGS